MSRVKKDIPSISRNVVYSFGAQAATLLVAILCMPMLVHLFGVERIGVLSLVWVIVGYFSILDFGIGPTVTWMAAISLKAGV